MKILISIFFALILVILTSKLKINIRYLNKNEKSLKIHFNVNLGVYWLGFVKIFGISLKEDAIYFLFLKFSYNKIKIDKENIKIFKEISILDMVKKLKIELEKLSFNMNLGTEDVMITVFSVFAISTFLSILLAQNSKKMNFKNYRYNIMPLYNRNALSFDISAQMSIKLINLVKVMNMKNKNEKKQYRNDMKKETIKI